jgi:regulation of enolase protein 1 (concanavalin A-like superfamily)
VPVGRRRPILPSVVEYVSAVEISLHGLTKPLTWALVPAAVTLADGGMVTVESGPRTDLFVDPHSGEVIATAPRALASAPDGDFQLLARVKVEFRATFDAGVLLVWFDERHTAKLCFELSPQGVPSVVSVVTNGVSDDANGWPVAGEEVWLRISRIGATWALHAGPDGQTWALARYFRLDQDAPAHVGILAQSPLGEGATVRFDQIAVVEHRLAELRDGS